MTKKKTRVLRVSIVERNQIVADIAAEFPCFGKGAEQSPSNPLDQWLKNQEPVFALGVKVREVVDYVLSRL